MRARAAACCAAWCAAAALLAAAGQAWAAPQYPCYLEVGHEVAPATYMGAPRNNPDGTYYPGDSFHYVVWYEAGPQCAGLELSAVRHDPGIRIDYHGGGPGARGDGPGGPYVDAGDGPFAGHLGGACPARGQHAGCVVGRATVEGGGCGPAPCTAAGAVIQEVTALKRVCRASEGGISCSTVPLDRAASAGVAVAVPRPGLELEVVTLQDDMGYDARNADGTFYPWDPVAILHVPVLAWKDERHATLGFETRTSDPVPKHTAIECGRGSCGMVLEHPGTAASAWELGNGEGVSVYEAAAGDLGPHGFGYAVSAANAGVQLGTARASAGALVVEYLPEHAGYPYPLLSDDGRTSYEDRASVALRYAGSAGGGPGDAPGLHAGRRSLVNSYEYLGAGYGPWEPRVLGTQLAWSEALDAGAVPGNGTACEVRGEGTAMFVRAGYCKIHFAYPVSGEVRGPRGPLHENVTLYNTLVSEGFGGRDRTFLLHYEYAFAEPFLHAGLHVRAAGPGGAAVQVPLEVSVGPLLGDPRAQRLDAYLHEKVLHDTGDAGLAGIVAGDVYPLEYSGSGEGYVHMKLRRTSSLFPEYSDGGALPRGLGIEELAPAYLAHSGAARLEVPLAAGLGALGPVRVEVSAGGTARAYEYPYADYSEDLGITVNLSQDNALAASRDGRTVSVLADPLFGPVTALYSNGTRLGVPCGPGCSFDAGEGGPLLLEAENAWGGRASAQVPGYVPGGAPAPWAGAAGAAALAAAAVACAAWARIRG